MTRKEKITKILDKYWIRRGWIESDESMVEARPLTAKVNGCVEGERKNQGLIKITNMEKFNKIRRTDKFNRFVEMMNGIEKLQKHQYTGILNDVIINLKEFAGTELVRAFEYRKKVMVIEDYCDRFFDCKEKGFSYELGCKYQKIDFDFPENIDGEIRWLENLCNVYNPEFKDELLIIRELIIDLGKFKKYFTEYYES